MPPFLQIYVQRYTVCFLNDWTLIIHSIAESTKFIKSEVNRFIISEKLDLIDDINYLNEIYTLTIVY